MAAATFAISRGPTAPIFGVIVVALLIVVNAGYGGGFSTLPALLSSRFGMDRISKIHGLALSAWAFAGLTGNNMSELILARTGRTYDYVLMATLGLYVVAMVICLVMVSGKKAAKQSA